MSGPVAKWAYEDVSNWLRQIGLGKYSELFAKHEINGEILMTMDEKDLSVPPLNIAKFGVIRKFGLKLEELKKARDDVEKSPKNDKNSLNERGAAYQINCEYEEKTRSDEIFSGFYTGETPIADLPPEMPEDQSEIDQVSEMARLYPDFCWRYQTNSDMIKELNHDGVDVTVVVPVSPAEFYVQPIYVVAKSQQLLSTMNDFYTNEMPPLPTDRVFLNMPCAVLYRDDPGWYRAIIREKGREEAIVVFVDWGNSQSTKYSDIKPLSKDFGRYPPLAIRCRIDGVGDRSLNQNVVRSFQQEIHSIKMFAKIVPTSFDHDDSVFDVRLLNLETKTDIGSKYIPEESPIISHPSLLSGGVVESANPIESVKPKSDDVDNIPYASDMEAFLNGEPGFDETDSGDEEEFKPRTKKLKQIKREILLKAHGKLPVNERETRFAYDGVEYVQEYPNQSKPPKGAVTVFVDKVLSAKEVFLRSDDQRKCLRSLENFLQTFINGAAEYVQFPENQIKPGTACVYKNADGRWIRAKFGDTDPQDSELPLVLVDYGRVVTVDRSNRSRIRPLPASEKLFSTEFQIYKCKIHKLCSSPLTAVETELLKELLPENEKLTAYFVREREPYKVHLEWPTTMVNFNDIFDREMIDRDLVQKADRQRSAYFADNHRSQNFYDQRLIGIDGRRKEFGGGAFGSSSTPTPLSTYLDIFKKPSSSSSSRFLHAPLNPGRQIGIPAFYLDDDLDLDIIGEYNLDEELKK